MTAFSRKGEARLGYKARRSWSLVEIEVCPITHPRLVAAFPALRALVNGQTPAPTGDDTWQAPARVLVAAHVVADGGDAVRAEIQRWCDVVAGVRHAAMQRQDHGARSCRLPDVDHPFDLPAAFQAGQSVFGKSHCSAPACVFCKP